MLPALTILEGDALAMLKGLPSGSVHCVVTSPPYWGLRDYGVAGQVGLEETPEAYVAKMVEVFREVKRVLRDDGTAWVNLGDSYAGGNTGNQTNVGQRFGKGEKDNGLLFRKDQVPGLKPKDLVGIPWRVAFALQADGWYLRSDIIWHKPNPMPESVTDRPTKAHEYLFLLSKNARYFYDAEAVKEQSITDDPRRPYGSPGANAMDPRGKQGEGNVRRGGFNGKTNNLPGREAFRAFTAFRNRRSVWTIPSEAFSGAHFATFPTALVKPCILAGTSAKGCCLKCGKPWERVVEKGESMWDERKRNGAPMRAGDVEGGRSLGSVEPSFSGKKLAEWKAQHPDQTTGWQPGCECYGSSGFECPDRCEVNPCTILDPFAGSGTTGAVALELGRHAVLIELNPAYVAMIRQRCAVTPGLQLA